ncbi:MAG: MFS transporter [Clostridiales Family XIII bacterium]|jgi:MFS family permease|nr:MFS transporter [Clostridiales Family XIII bacterium]
MTENKPSARPILTVSLFAAFAGLGLPNGILGVAWPVMRKEMDQPLESIGILTTIMLIMSMVGSVMIGRIMSRYPAALALSLSLLALTLVEFGIGYTGSFAALAVFMFPLGLVMGLIDSGANLYGAHIFSPSGMNFLHFFWGVGALFGPVIMVVALDASGWRSGWTIIAALCAGITVLLFGTLIKKKWIDIRDDGKTGGEGEEGPSETEGHANSKAKVLAALLLFFLHAGVLFILVSLLSSFLLDYIGTGESVAGISVTVFLASMTGGRVIAGVLAPKIGTNTIIRLGIAVGAAGCVIAAISTFALSVAGVECGIVVMGLGVAPVFPCLIHETPVRFRGKLSKSLVGYQVAAEYTGGALISLVAALLFSHTSLVFMFPMLALLFGGMAICNEYVLRQSVK